jgi:serine/threonine-protein kinase
MQDDSRIPGGLQVGDVLLGKYRIDRVLGAGGMGMVLAAHHLKLGQRVAIKLLLPEALEDESSSVRFEREARAAASIRSEHTVKVADIGTLESGAPYMVMEYLEGENLAERLQRRGGVPIDETVEIVLQTCEVLAEAHSLGIIHRDLKPANLFCVTDADNRISVKVLDFGISKVTSGRASAAKMSMTKTNAVMGSPFYMSPEQMESPRTVDARTDIWGIGIILYELLVGTVPFEGETLPEICMKIARQSVPSIRRHRLDVPPGLEAVVMKCLEKGRDERYASVAELAHALGPFAPRRGQTSIDRISRVSSLTPVQMPPDGPRTSAPAMAGSWWKSVRWPSRRPRTLGPVAIAAIAAVLLAAAGGWIERALSNRSSTSAATTSSESVAPTSRKAAALRAPPAESAPNPPLAESAHDETAPRPYVVPSDLPVETSKDAGPTRQPRTTPRPNPDCSMPYTFDKKGMRRFRPECLEQSFD